MQRLLVKTPVYQQLNVLLRELIRRGEFAPGQQFLTERQICERFEVSRATANKALSNLVAEGVLEFKKGIGTFVRGGVLQYDTNALVSFTERVLAAGKRPSTQILTLERRGAAALPERIRVALRVSGHEPVHWVERLRLADDVPVILERRAIAARFCPDLAREDLAGSLYAVWTQKYELEIAGADEVIRAAAIRAPEAGLLAVRSGTPGFLVCATGYLAGGTPLWWEETWYRGDMYEFRNRLGPIQTARPATGALRTAAP
jgi:GntR family transcriptional regulator